MTNKKKKVALMVVAHIMTNKKKKVALMVVVALLLSLTAAAVLKQLFWHHHQASSSHDDHHSGAGRHKPPPVNQYKGEWQLLHNNSGVVAMHTVVDHFGKVIMFDQNTFNVSGYPLHPPGRDCSRGAAANNDPLCWAHSVEYDPATNAIRPLTLVTDTWCSSGVFLDDGTLLQTGGSYNGVRGLRYYRPCADGRCDWVESEHKLSSDRWYATNQILPDSRVIVVGGRNARSYEFVPKAARGEGSYNLALLKQTQESRSVQWNNLYPMVYLSSDGNLFVFANRDSILLDYRNHRVLRTYPRIPGGASRSYPSTGSSVMLPLDHADGFRKVEIMICGGATRGAYLAAHGHKGFLPAQTTCGRMVITDEKPVWTMEEMPGPRLMNDMILLPDGNVLLINGAQRGAAGWDFSEDPSYSPYLYNPSTRTFSTLRPTEIPRLYHSSAVVIPDGRVVVAGSNPKRSYMTQAKPYHTEMRIEAFSPPYLDPALDGMRPTELVVVDRPSSEIKYGQQIKVQFQLPPSSTTADIATHDHSLTFYAYSPPFSSHSQAMNQRMLKLECRSFRRSDANTMQAVVIAPPSPVAAPMGYYWLTVVNAGVPSKYVPIRLNKERRH